MVVDKADLILSGINTAAYNVSGGTFSYDPVTFTATWTLPQVIGRDKLLLRLNADGSNPIQDAAGNRLDGEWTNPTSEAQASSDTYPSGNGTAGGDFVFRFNVLPADANQDSAVDISDLSALGQHWQQAGNPAQGDFTGNGVVDISDLAALGQNWNACNPLPGDANQDGAVNISDLSALGQHWQQPANWAQGDFSGNGVVDISDLAALGQHWNQNLHAGGLVAGASSAGALLKAASAPITGPSTLATSAASELAVSTPATSMGSNTAENEAIARWAKSSLNTAALQRLAQEQGGIGDLPGSYVGEAERNRIDLKTDAAENGRCVDLTPAWDGWRNNHQLQVANSRAVDRIDLLTLVEHKLGHFAGLDDLDAVVDDLIDGVLNTGIRPNASHIDAVLASG